MTVKYGNFGVDFGFGLLNLNELWVKICPKNDQKISYLIFSPTTQLFLFAAQPPPPVWHTSVFDSEGLAGGYIPFPYPLHTSLIPSIPSVGKKAGSKGTIEAAVEACASIGCKRIME